jgi:peptidoglycan/LPS O-acetylase OafA/YrhL
MFTDILHDSYRLQSLDFLRGFAVMSVFLTHFGLIDLQGIGVDLFFVLSGHLVSLSLWSTLSKSLNSKNYSVFFIKRIFRILPAYYVFLVVGYFLALALIKDISEKDIPIPSEFPQYFFFYRNLGGPPSRWSMEHLWSLSVEEQLYWLIPAMVAFFGRFYSALPKRFLVTALVLIIFGIGFKMQAIITDFAEWPTYTQNRIDAFGWGIWITFLLKEKSYSNLTIFNNKKLALTGAVLMLCCLMPFVELHELLFRTISPICWFLVILGLYNFRSKLFTPFRVLSFFSYGIYLWHFLFVIPVQHYLGKGIPGFLAYTVITFAFAYTSLYGVERPALRFRDMVLRRFSRSTSATLSEKILLP